ncbi:cytochrome P450 [Sorangium sp. So ce269]
MRLPLGTTGLVDHYEELRDERPVCPVELPSGDTVWMVSRHDDVKTVYTDRRFSRDLSAPGAPRTVPIGDWSDDRTSMILIMREAAESFDVDGYRIPKGAMVLTSPAVSHRLPDEYPNPHAYDPTR